jgi:DNA repair exonuclease SbcCD ATPase subunit
MRKLSKKVLKKIEEAQEAVTEAAQGLKDAIEEIKEDGESKLDTVREAIDEFNSWLEEARDSDLSEAFEAYKEAITDGRDVMEEIASEAENYYDDKSEKWQEGEKGEAYGEWRDRLRELADEFDEPDCPELEFSDIECPDSFEFEVSDEIKDGDELFDDIPEEPDGV